MLQRNQCKRQVSLTACTIFYSIKLPLITWFLAIYDLAQSRGGISSIALGTTTDHQVIEHRPGDCLLQLADEWPPLVGG